MADFWTKLLDLIERVAPGLLLAMGIGYQVGNRKVLELQNELLDAQLKLKEAQNNAKVDEDNRGLSDVDILLRATNAQSDKPDKS